MIVIMGSGAETAAETARYLVERGERVGVLQVRLYRPFPIEPVSGSPAAEHARRSPCSIAPRSRARPASRCFSTWSQRCMKLPLVMACPRLVLCPWQSGGATGFPPRNSRRRWSRRCSTSLASGSRSGASPSASTTMSATPASPTIPISTSRLKASPARCSSAWVPTARSAPTRTRSRSWARNRRSTPRVTSSTIPRNRGSRTISHLRFGPEPIKSPYLIPHANFIGCHQFNFLNEIDVLGHAATGAVLLLNTAHGRGRVWDELPREVQSEIIEKQLRVFVIDAGKVASERRHARTDQHDHADLFLCDLRGDGAGRCDREDQGGDREDLRQEGRRRGAPEFRGGRPDARPSARGGRSRHRQPVKSSWPRQCRTQHLPSCATSPRS